MPKVTFIVNGKEQTIEAEGGKTLLEIAQTNRLPMEAACGGNGFCATCKCKIRRGQENLSPFNDREEAMGAGEGERLGCQAAVQGDVTVELLTS